MPYSNKKPHETRIEYRNKINPAPFEATISMLKSRVDKTVASLCAVLSELEKRGIAKEIIEIASENGKIDLSSFWTDHKKEDRQRIQEELKKFSKHELDLIKKILNE